MRIFVSIASYRDPLLPYTIASLFDKKSQMTDVICGVFEQNELENSLITQYPEICALKNVRYKRIDPQYSEGVGWARHINSLQMQDEDFYYQIDSHIVFDNCWDRQLISDYKEAVNLEGSNKIIISSNCKNYKYIDGQIVLEEDRHYATNVKYFQFDENLLLSAHGDWVDPTPTVTPSIHVFAGNMFTHSDWVRDVGINPYMFFHGEEQVLTMSSFASGYKIFHGKQIPSYHYRYAETHTSKQEYQPVISEDIIQRRKERSNAEFKSFIRNLDDSVLERYKQYSGVDYINRKLENRAITRTVQPSIENDWEIP
jgi:hypothetical protein